MYFIYLIKSLKNGRIYTGYTADLKRRLTEHNNGKSPYTKNLGPWKLIYCEVYYSKLDAQAREKALKLRSKASAQLRKRISNSINES